MAITMKKLFYKLFLLLILIQISVFAQKPYVILISFDGFRWDYLNRGITPNLENIRNNGVSAISLRPAFPSKTFPNHISLITGMYPENHGIISNSFINPFNNKRYRMGDTNAVRDGRWYLGEAFWETAERNGIKTASYFWPGSEVRIPYKHPSYYEFYDHNRSYQKKIKGVIDWLKLPLSERPHFITLYFHETDTYAHDYGTNSTEINNAIKHLDNVTGYLLNELKNINMSDSINIIIVSDHGMTDISKEKSINIEKLLENYNCRFEDDGPVMMIEPPKQFLKEVYDILKKNENHYKVYLKDELPEYYHYNKHPFIFSIIVVADLGWSLIRNSKSDWLNTTKANHGYDNNQLDMHGIFLAIGPKFKKNYRTGTLWNIDLYPLLCKIFNIQPRSNIDGKLERIEFILKEN